MTSISEATKTGNDKIPANFHEVPAPSGTEEKVAMPKAGDIGGGLDK